ncbi:MAG: InlB B-repeat-containing protein [Acetatifactor sp.]|nr:InlB B-repeat-containing protein [Acetatifactor sp.]
MKLRKRLSAVILAAVMMVSSIQVPARVSYAAQLPEDSIGLEQEIFDGAITDDVSHAGDDKLPDDDWQTDAGNMEDVTLYAATYAESDLYTYLYQEMMKRNTRIDIESYQIGYKNADSLVSGVLNEHPDLYFVKKKFSINVNASGTKITSLVMNYSNDYDDSAFNDSVKEALSCVNDEMSDLEKVIALHDYLAVNIEYDYKNQQSGTLPDVSYTAYGALVNHTAVCEGYALAYKYLLNRLGIECYLVTSESMKHAWNMVKLDDEYYHVDVTSDDPVWDKVGQVRHDYMLFSDEAHMEKYSGWKVWYASSELTYKATDDSYDLAFWKDSNAPLVFSEGGCYYVSGDGSIRKGNCADFVNQGPEIANIGSWPTWDQSGTWPGVYSGLYMIDGRLYYNDHSAIYSIKTDGTDRQTAFTADTSNGYIYGSAYRQGKVYYALHKSPNLTAKEDVLVAEITGVSGVEVDPSIPEVGMKEGWGITPSYPKEGEEEFFTYSERWDERYICNLCPSPKGICLLMFVDGDGKDESWAQLVVDISKHYKYFDTSGLDSVYLDIICVDVSDGQYLNTVGQLFACGSNATFLQGSTGEKKNNGEFDYYEIDKQKALEYAKKYCEAVKEKNPAMAAASKPYPSLFYIKDQVIEYAEINQTSAYSMLCNLQEYCGYTRYALTYHYNTGDENDIIRTKYDASDKDISLPTPKYRDGLCFDGWYSDAAYTKRVTKIPAGTKSNIELYAKWSVRKGGFDLDNLEQEYTALDDSKITSTAEGKPKLLVFYDEYWNKREVINSISDALKENPDHALSGVDIYAIDWTRESKELIEERNTDISDKIIFSYAEDYTNYHYRSDYINLQGEGSNTTICYIDAQNRYQYMSGEADVDQIMFNLRTYCNYPTEGTAEFYMIRYELNGGTNNSKNPNVYHNEITGGVMLEAPTRDGYTFVGWYEDAAFTERVIEISPDRSGDITLYAKWKEKKGVNVNNPEYRFVTVDGNGAGVTTADDGRPKVMVFANENCGNSKTLVKDIKENIDLFKGADIVFAVVTQTNTTAANQYMSNLKDTYGCDGIIFCTDGGENATRQADYVKKGKYQTVNGYVFSPVIAYIDGNDKLQFVETRYNAEAVFNDLREYCNYDAYRINYVLGGGTNNSENPEVYLGDSQTITLKDPTRKGCVFEGWYKDIGLTKRVTEINPESKADYTLYAKWSVKKGGYDLENLTQEYTALDQTTTVSSAASDKPKLLLFCAYDTATGTLLEDVKKELDKPESLLHGVDVHVVSNAYNNAMLLKLYYANTDEITYSYDSNYDKSKKAYIDAAECGDGIFYGPAIVYIDENNALQYVYPGDKSTAVKVPAVADIIKALKKYCNYPSYDTYTITYELNGGTNSSENPATYTTETETITLADASKEGFTFAGWYQDAEFTESGKVTEIVKGSKGNITLYAKWEEASLEEKTYKITYELDGGTNDGNDNPGTYTAKTETIILKAAVKEGYVFDGWYKDTEFKEEVKEIVKGSTGDITLYAKWVESADYDNLEYTFTTIDGQTVSSKADGKAKVLFFFKTDCANCIQTNRSLSEHIGEFTDVDIYALEINSKTKDEVSAFKNEYGCDGITYCYDEGQNILSAMWAYYGKFESDTTTVTTPIIIFIDAENRLQHVTTGMKSGAEILADLQKYCNYTVQEEEKTYNITYELDGGTNDSENPSTYTAKTETIILKDAVKEGYIFEGWYKDAEFNEKVTEIVKGSTGNITLYARWSQADVTVSVIRPDKTTYKIGQELVVAGGKVVLTDKTGNNTEHNMELGMIKGFDSSKAGICKVMVTCDGYTGSFDTLIVEEPNLKASLGQRLGDITLPMNEYGTYTWAEGVNVDQKLTTAGVHAFGAVFTPKDTDKFQTLTDLQISVTVQDTSGEDEDGRLDLSTADVTIANIKAKVYDSLEYEPVLKVKLKVTVNGKKKTLTLVEGTDYSVEYENNVEVGTGTAYVTGNGMYKGEISKSFTINPKSVKKLKVITGNVAGSTMSERIDSDSADLPVYVYDGRKLLAKGEDINVAVKTSTAKSITVEITAANGSNYTGTRTAKLTVYEKASEENVINAENIVINGKTFDEECEIAYTGKALKPEVAVIVGNTTLTNKDYKVSYQNNKDAGTAYVIVTAKGAYKGKVVVPFRIVPVSPELTITNTIKAKTYNGKLQKPSVTVKAGKVTLKKNRDYKVTYTENLHAGTATVTVTARGNYTGSAEKTFVINKQNIKKVSVKGTREGGLSVYYGTRLLQENRDYTLDYGRSKGKNKIEVIITATEDSDFSGSVTKSVKIQ